MKGGFTKEELGLSNLERIVEVLKSALKEEKGIIGFGESLNQ
jgi:hypothetical protein